ncbi:Pycsar system effector family protein [Rathayibacter soli]|uniref:Pycsar system effector family protein n=1 Tax=Rathayibacter soli TaxID=3144168 RepID=UPI0027E411DE|nr:Pycsar system effector family protein [Glaciibacter superstes]
MKEKGRPQAVDAAWHVHNAQLDWTAKADAKAAFAFGIDSAAVAAVAILVSTGKVFSHFDHWWLTALFTLGGLGLLAGIVAASIGVAPRLKAKGAKKLSKTNYIYFGHARHWKAVDLEKRLRTDDLLPQLSRQITATADIAWKKHVAVNWSIWLTMGAGALLITYVLLTRIP